MCPSVIILNHLTNMNIITGISRVWFLSVFHCDRFFDGVGVYEGGRSPFGSKRGEAIAFKRKERGRSILEIASLCYNYVKQKLNFISENPKY